MRRTPNRDAGRPEEDFSTSDSTPPPAARTRSEVRERTREGRQLLNAPRSERLPLGSVTPRCAHALNARDMATSGEVFSGCGLVGWYVVGRTSMQCSYTTYLPAY
jgi:hypothetical protein